MKPVRQISLSEAVVGDYIALNTWQDSPAKRVLYKVGGLNK